MPEEINQPPAQKPVESKLSEDFYSAYANQVRFETSAWDLKIVFGQVDQRSGTAIVEWHTAITIPWTQAKMGVYTLQAMVAGFEAFYGKVQIPWDVVPPPPTAPTEEEAKQNPPSKTIYEAVLKCYEQFKTTL